MRGRAVNARDPHRPPGSRRRAPLVPAALALAALTALASLPRAGAATPSGAAAAGAGGAADGGAVSAAADSAARAAAAGLLARARDHAAADRHGPAARDYRAALARDPGLFDPAARELAWQLLWREDAAQAAGWFRRWLASRPGGADPEARRGLALALSWAGEQDAAIGLYRELAAAEPADAGLRQALGRCLIWDNRLREGWAESRAVETAGGAEAVPEAGTEADAAAGSPAAREAGRFLLTVLDEYDVPWQARFDHSHDSDRLDIARAAVTATLDVPPSLLLQALPSRTWYRQDGQPEVTAWRLGAGLVAPLAPAWNLHAYGWVDRFRSGAPIPASGRPEALRWTQPGGDAWVTWHAAPRLRWDAGASVLPVESLAALGRRTRLAQGSLSGEWRLARRWSLAGLAQRAGYNDGNRRWLATARLQWRREGRLAWQAGPAATWLDCRRPGFGYWSPDWMRNAVLEGSAQTRGRLWTLRLSGRYGWEKELGAGSLTIGGWSARLAWRCRPGLLLALEGGHAKSRLASAAGYGRDFVSLAARGFF